MGGLVFKIHLLICVFFNCQVFWFTFGCAGSSLLHGLFSCYGQYGLLSSWDCGPLVVTFLLVGLVAPWHVVPSWIRDQTHVSCIGRWILNTGSPGKALSGISNLSSISRVKRAETSSGSWDEAGMVVTDSPCLLKGFYRTEETWKPSCFLLIQ